MAGITIQPPGWPPPRGYSNGILSACAEILAVAGQIGWDTSGRIVGSSFVRQFEQALDNVLTVVRAGGGTAGNIVQMRIYVVDKREYASHQREIGAVWQQKMGRYYPAISLVQVAALLEDEAKVEIEAVAALPPRGRDMPVPEDESSGEFDPPTKTVPAVGLGKDDEE